MGTNTSAAHLRDGLKLSVTAVVLRLWEALDSQFVFSLLLLSKCGDAERYDLRNRLAKHISVFCFVLVLLSDLPNSSDLSLH